MSLLTIAIPTFNRHEKLLATINRLAVQVDTSVNIRVHDNFSKPSAREYIRNNLNTPFFNQIEFVENSCNIGASANFLRCFELCETRWLWLLGDDDNPLSDAISSVLQTIKTQEDSLFINFIGLPSCKRNKEFSTYGQSQFIHGLDDFSNSLFISTSIFRADILKENLHLGHQTNYSMAGYYTLLLVGLGSKGRAFFSTKKIVQYCQPDAESKWPQLRQFIGMSLVFDLNFQANDREKLAKKMSSAQPKPLIALLEVALRNKSGAISMADASHFCGVLRSRCYRYHPFWKKLIFICSPIVVRYPNVFINFVRTWWKIRKCPTSVEDIAKSIPKGAIFEASSW